MRLPLRSTAIVSIALLLAALSVVLVLHSPLSSPAARSHNAEAEKERVVENLGLFSFEYSFRTTRGDTSPGALGKSANVHVDVAEGSPSTWSVAPPSLLGADIKGGVKYIEVFGIWRGEDRLGWRAFTLRGLPAMPIFVSQDLKSQCRSTYTADINPLDNSRLHCLVDLGAISVGFYIPYSYKRHIPLLTAAISTEAARRATSKKFVSYTPQSLPLMRHPR